MGNVIVTETNGQKMIFRNQPDSAATNALMQTSKGEGIMLRDAEVIVAYAPGSISNIMIKEGE